MRNADQIVQSEVLCCMSHLVSTLAAGYALPIGHAVSGGADLEELCTQAFELAAPIEDWREAAEQAGWEAFGPHAMTHSEHGSYAGDWQELCEAFEIEPYQWDVFEHWAVTDWLADQLLEHGEKVDKDFGGLCVWARTTTGQGIAMDSVFERIVADLARKYGESV